MYVLFLYIYIYIYIYIYHIYALYIYALYIYIYIYIYQYATQSFILLQSSSIYHVHFTQKDTTKLILRIKQ